MDEQLCEGCTSVNKIKDTVVRIVKSLLRIEIGKCSMVAGKAESISSAKAENSMLSSQELMNRPKQLSVTVYLVVCLAYHCHNGKFNVIRFKLH